jgi:hypothetical protein
MMAYGLRVHLTSEEQSDSGNKNAAELKEAFDEHHMQLAIISKFGETRMEYKHFVFITIL